MVYVGLGWEHCAFESLARDYAASNRGAESSSRKTLRFDSTSHLKINLLVAKPTPTDSSPPSGYAPLVECSPCLRM